MKYTIHIDQEAKRHIASTFHYILEVEKKPLAAQRWLEGLDDAIDSLETMPERCSHARENDRFVQTVRKLIYKSTRLVFIIEGECVYIIAAPHAHQDDLQESDRLTEVEEEGLSDGE